MSTGYSRALLKISGEALAGNRGYGLDPEKTSWIAEQIARPAKVGRQLGIVIGGGNILRGKEAFAVGVSPITADQMGMVATVINAMALRGALETVGVPSIVMSAFAVGRFVQTYQREDSIAALENGKVVIFAGGTGNPCFTTDTAAALRAAEIETEVLVKATQVAGVFDKDPRTHPDAVMLEHVTAQEVLKRGLDVIDAAAADILARKRIRAIVLDLHKDGNLWKALAGQTVGTLIE